MPSRQCRTCRNMLASLVKKIEFIRGCDIYDIVHVIYKQWIYVFRNRAVHTREYGISLIITDDQYEEGWSFFGFGGTSIGLVTRVLCIQQIT